MARPLRDRPEVPAIISAAVTAYAFVFLHPFSDGNGRIHRFLIHHILAGREFTPEKVIFPVSAVMLSRSGEYDQSLESFSRPLMELIAFELDDEGCATVLNETADFYRYINYTTICEFLFSFIEETIEKELPAELTFLEQYDQAIRAMRNVVDLPDRLADLFVRIVVQNKGRLSKAKRQAAGFSKLTDQEVEQLESSVRNAYGF